MSKLADKVGSGETISITGKKNHYVLCKYLVTTSGIEYYCCKGDDGLWRILGVAEIHRYNGRVKELAENLGGVSRRCQAVEEDYEERIIGKFHASFDRDVAHDIHRLLYYTVRDRRLRNARSTFGSLEFDRFSQVGLSRHYTWLFPLLIECFTAPELDGRRVIILEPQDINLDETVCLRELLDKSGILDVKTVVWVTDWLCRVADLLAHGSMIMKFDMENIYIEPAARRLFVLDWSKVFFLNKGMVTIKEGGNANYDYCRGVEHFLMNISRIGGFGMEMLGLKCRADVYKDEKTEAGKFAKYLSDLNELMLPNFGTYDPESTYGIDCDYMKNGDCLEKQFRKKIEEIWSDEDVDAMVE